MRGGINVRTSSYLAWAAVAALLPALCAGCPKNVQLPDYYLDPGSHPDYPSNLYIVGVGRSDESLAAAEQAGRAEVSRQVASEILVQVRREVEVIDDGERPRVRKLTEQAISEKTNFERGELIRTDPGSSIYDGDHFWSFVFLDRRKADATLAAEQTGLESRLDDLKRRSVAAAREGDPVAFVHPAREFWLQYERWDALRFQRRALAGGEGGNTNAVENWGDEVMRAEGALQDRIVWVVRVQPAGGEVPGETIAALQHAFTEGLSQLGLKTVLSTKEPCSERTDDRDLAYGLEAAVGVEQGLGYIGYEAVLDVAVEGTQCFGSGNHLFRTTLDRRSLVGVHTSSKQRALELANDKLLARCDELDKMQVESCSVEGGEGLLIAAQLVKPLGNICPLP